MMFDYLDPTMFSKLLLISPYRGDIRFALSSTIGKTTGKTTFETSFWSQII